MKLSAHLIMSVCKFCQNAFSGVLLQGSLKLSRQLLPASSVKKVVPVANALQLAAAWSGPC